jgi:hypothetical protein
MHRFSIVIFLSLIVFSGFAQTNILEKKISVIFKGVTLQEAIVKLEKKAGITVAYSNILNSYKEKIDKKNKKKTVKNIFDDLLSVTNIN